MSDIEIEDVPAPKPRGRPRKVIVEEAPPPPPEPAKRGRPKKVVEEAPPEAPPEPPPKKRTKKQRDPSELEPKQVSFSTSRGERSFAARAPKKMPQPEPQVQEAPQPGPFHALHHRPVSARQAALENLMANWR